MKCRNMRLAEAIRKVLKKNLKTHNENMELRVSLRVMI